jgi:integrase
LKESSLREYEWRIRRFMTHADIENFTRRQLKSKGAQLIRTHLEKVEKASWVYELSALKDFWRNGLRLDWPSEVSSIIGRLPKPGRRFAPRTHIVEKWAAAIEKEPDLWTRLLVLLTMEFGWRPSHLYNLKIRNIRYDPNGVPEAIVADGEVEGFKTSAWIGAYLPPTVREALQAFFEERGKNLKPEYPILPWRHENGKIVNEMPLNPSCLDRFWGHFIERWKLPKLTRVDFRHFACWQLDLLDMTNMASAYMVGHDSGQGETYRNRYANAGVEEAILEQQRIVPGGILGIFKKVEIEQTQGIPRPMIDLMTQFIEGKVDQFDLAKQAWQIRNTMAESAKNMTPEP